MARCEDFPCCGHEPGCCPDFDGSGQQLNMVCTCGAKLPPDSRFSICDACLDAGEEDEGPDESWRDYDDEPDVDDLTEQADFEQADEYFGYYGDE